MNNKLIESLAGMILSLSKEERILLENKLNAAGSSPKLNTSIEQQVLDLEKSLKSFESQYQMSSEEFYQRFRSGDLGDGSDFFEWSAFYEMWKAAQTSEKLF
jgi:hypothetical protein